MTMSGPSQPSKGGPPSSWEPFSSLYPEQVGAATVNTTADFDEHLLARISDPATYEDIYRAIVWEFARNGRVFASPHGSEVVISFEPGMAGLPETGALVKGTVERLNPAGVRVTLTMFGPLPPTADDQDDIEA